jgi:hypothetical protein
MLKHAVVVLVVVVSLLAAVGAAAFAVGKAGSSDADIGVGPTDLLVDGVLDPNLA